MLHPANRQDVERLGLEHACRPGQTVSSPLVFLVHGRAGGWAAMRPFVRCIPEDFGVFSLEAPLADPLGGYSWWRARGSLENESDWIDEARQAAGLAYAFMQNAEIYYGLAPRRRLAFGFSQGGALLSVLISACPRFLDGAAILAGVAAQSVMVKHGAGARTRIFIAHGTRDEKLSIAAAKGGADFLRRQGFEVIYVEDNSGHKVGTRGMQALKVWTHSFGPLAER